MTPRATQTWGKINPGDAMTVSKAMPLAFAVAELCFRSAQGRRFESLSSKAQMAQNAGDRDFS